MFLQDWQPNNVLIEIGWLKIHWYGLLIAIGAFLGFLLVLYLSKKYKLKTDHIYNLAFYLIIFGLIGDRLYYVFYAWDYYSQNLLDIFKIWEGGLAIHGAMIAGLIVIYIHGKKNKISFWLLTDLSIIALPLAMAIGRWGNFFNMELFGRPTNLPWGIFIDQVKRPLEFIDFEYFHPTFLYESLWNLVILVVLLVLHQIRLNKNKNNPEKSQVFGNITLIYFILYSIGRFFNEFLRLDYSPYFLNIRWAQFVSLIVILVCIIVFVVKRIYARKVISND